MVAPLSPLQRKLARHALGLHDGIKLSYRNVFVCAPGHPAYEPWEAMVALGHAFRNTSLGDQIGEVFHLTAEAAQSVLLPGETLDLEDFRPRSG